MNKKNPLAYLESNIGHLFLARINVYKYMHTACIYKCHTVVRACVCACVNRVHPFSRVHLLADWLAMDWSTSSTPDGDYCDVPVAAAVERLEVSREARAVMVVVAWEARAVTVVVAWEARAVTVVVPGRQALAYVGSQAHAVQPVT